MSYAQRIRSSALRVARHFPGATVTLKDRNPGTINTSDLTRGSGSTTTYTVTDGLILSADEYYAARGLTPTGNLIVSLPRASGSWSPSQSTPKENWEISVSGRVGVVERVHTKAPVWVLECKESS